jgi:hypothetical protein
LKIENINFISSIRLCHAKATKLKNNKNQRGRDAKRRKVEVLIKAGD